MRACLLFAVLSLVAAGSHGADIDSAVAISFEEAMADELTFRPSMPGKKEVNRLSTRCYDSATGQTITHCNISIKVKAISGSGGHKHSKGARPMGSVSPASGNSGASGILYFNYTSPEVSGNIEITVTGSKSGYTFLPGVGQVLVGVKGLALLKAGADYNLVGQTSTHPVNHYGVPAFHQKLVSLAKQYRSAFPGSKLNFNDMSLVFGGLFDIKGAWKPAHAEHRIGFSEDLRLVPSTHRAKLELMLKSLGLGIHKEEKTNHWHIRFDPKGRL